jgi:hypothetical protein
MIIFYALKNYYYSIACTTTTFLDIAPINVAIGKNDFFHLYEVITSSIQIPLEIG